MDDIILDIKNKLQIEIDEIEKYDDGTTDSLVFSVNKKYLIKTMTESELNYQIEFFKYYNQNKWFQDLVYVNKELGYICFLFIDGLNLKKIKLDPKKIVDELYQITRSYVKYNADFYGYLEYSKNDPYEFLLSEIEYAKEKISNIDATKVYIALNNLKKYKISKYLLHGDFGAHNFLIENNTLRVIDPYPLVFDPLYDFYFAVLSSSLLFVEIDYLLKFSDRDIEYKKNLFIIVFYIRLSRSYMYDKENFNVYLNIYNNLENYLWKK